MSDEFGPIQPTANYWDSDGQLFPTVGPDDSDIEAVEAASTETVRRVLDAIQSPKKVPQPDSDEIDAPQVRRSDGKTGELPMMEIPGFGEEYDDCGKPMPMACSGCGHTATVGRTCRRSTCPRCGAAWVRDRSKNICAQLGATRAVRDKNREAHQRYHHLAWMPPEDWKLESKDVLERTLKVVRDIMYALDIEGYVFYHPWSGSGYDEEEGDDRGKWKDRLFNDREWKGDVRDELKFRPHFHIVCVGHKVPGQDFTELIYEKTNWILTRITKSEDNAVSIYDDEDLAKVVTYCLSHSAIDRDGASDGSAQRTYRRYGQVVTHPDVSPDDTTLEHHDRLVRQAATTTLGIPMKDQFCFAETYGNTGMDDWDSVRSAITAQAAADSDGSDDMGSSSGSSSDADNDATADPDAPDPVAMDGRLTTPAKKAEENPSLDLEEATECEGQMVHLCDARHLLDDDDWLEQAEHADELQTTLDEWEDRMDELIRWGPFNSG